MQPSSSRGSHPVGNQTNAGIDKPSPRQLSKRSCSACLPDASTSTPSLKLRAAIIVLRQPLSSYSALNAILTYHLPIISFLFA
jgi:hypothetical protein